MTPKVTFHSVHPIGDTDIGALPVKVLGPAVGYYTQVLGFSLISKEESRAVLRRDDAQIGLAVNGRDPDQASCYFAVSDVAALYAELAAKGIEPSKEEMGEHEGRMYRIIFAKDPYGVCFCFGQPA